MFNLKPPQDDDLYIPEIWVVLNLGAYNGSTFEVGSYHGRTTDLNITKRGFCYTYNILEFPDTLNNEIVDGFDIKVDDNRTSFRGSIQYDNSYDSIAVRSYITFNDTIIYSLTKYFELLHEK